MDESIVADITSRIEAFKEKMDFFSEKLYDDFIENMSPIVEHFILIMEANREKLERAIGGTLKKMEL